MLFLVLIRRVRGIQLQSAGDICAPCGDRHNNDRPLRYDAGTREQRRPGVMSMSRSQGPGLSSDPRTQHWYIIKSAPSPIARLIAIQTVTVKACFIQSLWEGLGDVCTISGINDWGYKTWKHEDVERGEARQGIKRFQTSDRLREERRERTKIRSTTSRGPGCEALTSLTQAELHLYIRSQTSDKKEAGRNWWDK